MNRKALPLVAFLTLVSSPAAFADFLVSIGNATLQQGRATVDVDLQNTGATPIRLDQYGLKFQIFPVGNAPMELSFVDPQPQPFANPSYVFSGNSLADPGPLGNVSTTSTPDDTYSASDATLDGTNVTIAAGSTTTLLTQLEVSYNGNYVLTSGTFRIALTPSDYLGPPATPDANTFFEYADSQGIQRDLGYSVSSNSGLIFVTAVVPEPSTIALLATGVVLSLLAGSKRHLQARR